MDTGTTVLENPETKVVNNFVNYYKVILHNDTVNSFDFVRTKVREVFRFTEEESFKVVMEAHTKDYAVCVIEPFEHAEMHKERLASFRIFSSIEPA